MTKGTCEYRSSYCFILANSTNLVGCTRTWSQSWRQTTQANPKYRMPFEGTNRMSSPLSHRSLPAYRVAQTEVGTWSKDGFFDKLSISGQIFQYRLVLSTFNPATCGSGWSLCNHGLIGWSGHSAWYLYHMMHQLHKLM